MSPVQLVTAIVVALGLGGAMGLAYGFVLDFLYRVPFVYFIVYIIFLALGYTIGEAVARAAPGKRGTVLQVVAGAGVVVLYLVGNLIAYGVLFVLQPVMLLVAVITVAVAASRIR